MTNRRKRRYSGPSRSRGRPHQTLHSSMFADDRLWQEVEPFYSKSTEDSNKMTDVQLMRSPKKTNAQKCREYRERKKLEEGIDQRWSDEEEAKKYKTNAQMGKEYRERQKMRSQQCLSSQSIIVEIEPNQPQLDPTCNKNVKKKQRQQRYREQNRERLKQREADRRRRKHVQINDDSNPSLNTTLEKEMSNEQITHATQYLSKFKGTETAFY